jgi:hypothetical protein
MNVHCQIPVALKEDWESRGLVHNMSQDGVRFWVKMRGKAKMVSCSPEVLKGLRADAEWLLDPVMGSDARLKAACRKFIANADEIIG